MIQSLSTNDVSRVIPLNQKLHAFHVAAVPEVFHDNGGQDERETYFRDLLAKPDNFVFVWHEAGMDLGYALFLRSDIGPDLWRSSAKVGLLDHIYVEEGARRRGIGLSLIEAGKARLRAQGVARFATSWWAFNKDSAGLMARAGFVPQVIRAGMLL